MRPTPPPQHNEHERSTAPMNKRRRGALLRCSSFTGAPPAEACAPDQQIVGRGPGRYDPGPLAGGAALANELLSPSCSRGGFVWRKRCHPCGGPVTATLASSRGTRRYFSGALPPLPPRRNSSFSARRHPCHSLLSRPSPRPSRGRGMTGDPGAPRPPHPRTPPHRRSP